MKVWLVMVGCVGDISVYKVCSTEEKAKETVEWILKYEKYGKSLNPYYEEWEVDKRRD